jgi:hypothetical protein
MAKMQIHGRLSRGGTTAEHSEGACRGHTPAKAIGRFSCFLKGLAWLIGCVANVRRYAQPVRVGNSGDIAKTSWCNETIGCFDASPGVSRFSGHLFARWPRATSGRRVGPRRFRALHNERRAKPDHRLLAFDGHRHFSRNAVSPPNSGVKYDRIHREIRRFSKL